MFAAKVCKHGIFFDTNCIKNKNYTEIENCVSHTGSISERILIKNSTSTMGMISLTDLLPPFSKKRTPSQTGQLLCSQAIADFEDNNAYWAKFDGLTAKVMTTTYEGFLQSYGQDLGMKSYGACVDLLVARYCSQ